MAVDYYQVLGLERTATEEEIKRSYRKLAVRWHPDKNRDNIEKAEEEFKKVGEAYSVLSDPEKRAAYDRYGHEAAHRGSHAPFHTSTTDAEEIFRAFFGGQDPFAELFGRAAGGGVRFASGGHGLFPGGGGIFMGGRGMGGGMGPRVRVYRGGVGSPAFSSMGAGSPFMFAPGATRRRHSQQVEVNPVAKMWTYMAALFILLWLLGLI